MQKFIAVLLGIAMGSGVFFSVFAQSNDVVCTQEYNPVCGKVQIQCITTPCDPVWETFGNACMANARGATDISQGECPAGINTGINNNSPVCGRVIGGCDASGDCRYIRKNYNNQSTAQASGAIVTEPGKCETQKNPLLQCYIFTKELKIGSRNSRVVGLTEVSRLQIKMRDLGYFNGYISGFYGRKLARAVAQFQADNKIHTSGRLNTETGKKLFEITCR